MSKIIKNNLGLFLVIGLVLVVVFCSFEYLPVKASNQRINIFPTFYSNIGWENPEAAFSQDLGENATLKEFNKENSAYSSEILETPMEETPYHPEKIDTGQTATSTQEELIEETPELPFQDSTGQTATSTEEELIEEEIGPSPVLEPPIEEIIPPVPSETEGKEAEPTTATSTQDFISEDIELEESEPIQTGTSTLGILLTLGDFEEEVLHQSVLIFSDFWIPDEFKKSKINNTQLRFSLAGKPHETDTKLVIDYYYGDSWQLAGEIVINKEISNTANGGYWLYGLPVFENWDDLENLKIRFTYLTENLNQQSPQIYLDAIWLEVEHGEKEEPEAEWGEGEPSFAKAMEGKEDYTLELISNKKGFKLSEKPVFRFQYQKKKGFFESIGASIWNPSRDEYKDINIKATVSGLNINPSIRYQENGEFLVELERPRAFQPGKYKLKIEIEYSSLRQTQDKLGSEQVQEFEQDFTWGVLAINFNKSIYLSNDPAYIQMGVLDDEGHTLCDADLILEITDPKDRRTVLKTVGGTITRNPECGPDNVIDKPDYFTYWRVGEVGSYLIELRAFTINGMREIRDQFEVRDWVPFDIERIGPTRIYPPVSYQMEIRIKANQDFNGLIIESMPDSFEVLSPEFGQIRTQIDTKEIVWQVDWSQGETHELIYRFDAPDISPYLYLVGPLEFHQ